MRFTGLTALVLHVRPYRESSAIVQFFTREQGRIAGVVRGLRRGKHPQRVEPFGYGEVSFSGRGELMTVTQLDLSGRFALAGDTMAAGFYVLEVLSRVLGERQAEPALYRSTQETLNHLASLGDAPSPQAMAVYLRSFEVTLLEALGYGIDFEVEADGRSEIVAEGQYRFDADVGFRRVAAETASEDPLSALPGRVLNAIAAGDFSTADARRCARLIFAEALTPLLGNKPLVSRSLWQARNETNE